MRKERSEFAVTVSLNQTGKVAVTGTQKTHLLEQVRFKDT